MSKIKRNFILWLPFLVIFMLSYNVYKSSSTTVVAVSTNFIAMVDENTLAADTALTLEGGSVKKLVIEPFLVGNLVDNYNYSQLEKMVYSGNFESQLLAIKYLPLHSISSMPLLFYLVNANTDIQLKEAAILALLSLDEDDIENIIASLSVHQELMPLLSGLGIVHKPSSNYVSPYQNSPLLTDNPQYYDVFQQLKSANDDERRLGVYSAKLLDHDSSKEVLTEILKHDGSEIIRGEVYLSVVARFPENIKQWAELALEDESYIINFYGLEIIENNLEHINNFIPLLARMMYSRKPAAIKEKVASLLLGNYLLIEDEAIHQLVNLSTES